MKRILSLIGAFILGVNFANCQLVYKNLVNTSTVAAAQFGNDKEWYIQNIPFFECSDKKIEQVYYYRWKLYKAHLKNLGAYGYIVTEFLNTMDWDLKPYNSLNDATSFHIYEGRWLKNTRYVSDYINFMYQKGGNDRHFSEAIADAAYAYYKVNPDKAFIVSQLPSMVKIYNDWYDHYDRLKGLYYNQPLLDATEYTIASIDASGGKDGFRGGDSFRPSINSYMYANALAIKNIALIKNDTVLARKFAQNAAQIKNAVQGSLWNTQFGHFIDRFEVNNKYVKYWDFIRGRELVGYAPWAFNLPDDNRMYDVAWQHILSADELKGKYGLRTNEPSYQYYMKQYRYDKNTGQRECQVNGPSWPFQTTLVLLGMANVLNDYHQHTITVNDYYNVLKQYTLQHYMADGHLNLIEDYDPDKGGPIVNYDQRSEHYNHSEYNDLIITGLCGLRPVAGDSLVINPLIDPNTITYFCLQNVQYHGHAISIIYDENGKKYNRGKGLSIFIDSKLVVKNAHLQKEIIKLPGAIIKQADTAVNLAVHLGQNEFPKASASFTDPSVNVDMAIDGRIWFFNDVRNYWSPLGSGNTSDWYQVEFEKPTKIHSAHFYFYADNKKFAAPANFEISYWDGTAWQPVTGIKPHPLNSISNTLNIVAFDTISTNKIRVTFAKPQPDKYVALAEMEIY